MRHVRPLTLSLTLGVLGLSSASLMACGGRISPEIGALDGGDDGGNNGNDGAWNADDEPPPAWDAGYGDAVDPWDGSVDDGDLPFDGGTPDTGTRPDTFVPDTGAVVDTAVQDTGTFPEIGPNPNDSGPTLSEVCTRIAQSTCSPSFQKCCISRGQKWDELGCEDVMNNWCDDGRDGVFAGKTTYDPSWAQACAQGWSVWTSSCSLNLMNWIKSQAPCSQMYKGKTAPGGACQRDTDCAANVGFVARCDESSKICRSYGVVGLGQACNYFTSAPRWCDNGLTCDFSNGAGVCVKATPLGGACFGSDDTSCGFGYVCTSGKCAVGRPVGQTCEQDLQCASWDCSGGKCTDSMVSAAVPYLCGGF